MSRGVGACCELVNVLLGLGGTKRCGAQLRDQCMVRYTPQEAQGTWERIKIGFKENLYSVTEGVKNFFIGLIISIPTLSVFLVVIVILLLVVKLIMKWKKKRSDKKRERQTKMQQTIIQENGVNAESRVQNTPQNSMQKGMENKNE